MITGGDRTGRFLCFSAAMTAGILKAETESIKRGRRACAFLCGSVMKAGKRNKIGEVSRERMSEKRTSGQKNSEMGIQGRDERLSGRFFITEVSKKFKRPGMSCYILRKAKMMYPGERSSDYNAAKTTAQIGMFGKETSRVGGACGTCMVYS